MKKIFLLIFCLILLLCGCGKYNENSFIRDYQKKIQKLKSYKLSGKLEIVNNNDVYDYDIVVSYKKNNKYKVYIKNDSNEHEQYILRNNDGVYLLTPSLNKSFKFQSDWPYNSSQVYILSSLLKDLESDDNVLYEEIDKKYILSSTVDYPNNTNLLSQRITFSEEILPEKVSVYDKDGNECITLKISKIDFKNKLKEEDFDIDDIESNSETTTTSGIDEVMYPMYLPVGTKFKSEETIKSDESERVILTFSGDKSFILIEEASLVPDELEVTTTSGELVFYENILGSLNESSLNWSMNGKDYYLIGNNMSNDEILKVASSMNVAAITK